MRHCFVVLGYGIPQDILKDTNYQTYLGLVFNAILDQCTKQNRWDPVIVFSGGKTDMVKPYRRTEAGEMIKVFRDLMQRPVVKQHVRHWQLIPEMRALSTLDNFLYTAEILQRKRLTRSPITVFGEQTRRQRIATIAKKTLKQASIMAIDFDQSANRYLDPALIQEKETNHLKLDLWALRNQTNLQKHRALFKKRIVYLRKIGPEQHVDAIRQWWKQELQKTLYA